MLYWKDAEFLLNGAWILMIRHEKSNWYNLTLHGQIFSKFHTFDKSPKESLKTSTGQFWLETAPPTGNRILYVQHPPQIWSEMSSDPAKTGFFGHLGAAETICEYKSNM